SSIDATTFQKGSDYASVRLPATMKNGRRFFSSLLILISVLLIVSVWTAAQDLLPLKAETLSGKQVIVPDAASGNMTLLIIGFTHKSAMATRAWGERVDKDYGSESRLSTYQVAVLEDVPRFIRGFVVAGIRNSVPKERRDHFLLLFQGEKEWKMF